MDQKIQEKIELFARNSRIARKSAKLDFNAAADLAALMFTAEGFEADEATIRANRALLKQRAGLLSNMRSASTNMAVLANMSMADDATKYLDEVFRAYDVITDGKIYRDENLAFAAMNMVETLSEEEYREASEKAWAMLAKMRSLHPLLTSQSDYSLALMLSRSDLDVDALLAEAELCYDKLKRNGFMFNKDTLQSICMILALSDKPVDQKCLDFLDLRASLKEAGHRIGFIEQAVIAAFVDLDVPGSQLVQEIAEADDLLHQQKGFGFLRCGTQMRRMFASALVLQAHSDEKRVDGMAGKAVAQYVAQQIIAFIITMIIITSISASHRYHSN